jgi:hypothetical protein
MLIELHRVAFIIQGLNCGASQSLSMMPIKVALEHFGIRDYPSKCISCFNNSCNFLATQEINWSDVLGVSFSETTVNWYGVT